MVGTYGRDTFRDPWGPRTLQRAQVMVSAITTEMTTSRRSLALLLSDRPRRPSRGRFRWVDSPVLECASLFSVGANGGTTSFGMLGGGGGLDKERGGFIPFSSRIILRGPTPEDPATFYVAHFSSRLVCRCHCRPIRHRLCRLLFLIVQTNYL